MSRWSPYRKMNLKKEKVIWINKPKRLYKITTDQKEFFIKSDFLDYKQTIIDLKSKGYTSINISYIGYDVTF